MTAGERQSTRALLSVPVATSVARFYVGWQLLNDRLVERIASLSSEELGWTPAPDLMPIWAIAAHLAGTRVYWLCHVLKEPGADTTPFADPSGEGWEDDLSHPRGADELVFALRSTSDVVTAALGRWTPEMLAVEFPRERAGKIQLHTRQSILWRLITHGAAHTGEISLILGSHGQEGIDPWAGLSRVV